MCGFAGRLYAFNQLIVNEALRGVQGVVSVFSFSAQPDATMKTLNFLYAPLGSTVAFTASRFAYILDHYGHARSDRRASARRGEAPL